MAWAPIPFLLLPKPHLFSLLQSPAREEHRAQKSRQTVEDVHGLMVSGLELKQALRATEETLARTEAALEATTGRLEEAEAQAGRLEAQRREQARHVQEQATELLEEREKLVANLAEVHLALGEAAMDSSNYSQAK